MTSAKDNPDFCNFLARLFLFIFGCAALVWGLWTSPIFWRQSYTQRIATRIIAGESFKRDVLAEIASKGDTTDEVRFCHPSTLRNAAIIRVRLAEVALSSGDKKSIETEVPLAVKAVRNSLSCLPSDPFLWLALFSLDNSQNTLDSRRLKYMQLSYRLGPREGWIALRRNPIAFKNFEQLKPELAEDILGEFVVLLETGLTEQVAEIFVGPAWPVHQLILPRLDNVPQRFRQRFAKALYAQGYDVVVPGVERAGVRPWH